MKKQKKMVKKIVKNKKNLLKTNLTALKLAAPALAQWMDKKKNVDWVQEIHSENGDKNLIIQNGSKLQTAYDMQNPTKIADDAIKEMNLYKENVSVLIGFGLG